jgi:hypothetical protein
MSALSAEELMSPAHAAGYRGGWISDSLFLACLANYDTLLCTGSAAVWQQFLQDQAKFFSNMGDPVGLLKAGGIPALALYCIWQIYKIIFKSRHLTPKQKLYSGLIGMVCAAAISVFYFVPFIGWVTVETNADWPGEDVDCSPGAAPVGALCYDNVLGRVFLGRVAVCWTDNQNKDYPSGEFAEKCKDQKDWCTYRNAKVFTQTTGIHKGTIHICARRL